MVTRKKPALTPVALTDQEQIFHTPTMNNDEELPDETAEDRVYTMLESMSENGKSEIKVYKKGENGALGYCKAYSAVAFEQGGFDMIRDNFGSGDFEMRLYGKHPVSQSYRMLQRQIVTIVPLMDNAPITQQKSGVENSQMVSLLEKILERQNVPQPQIDSMAQMTQMFGMMKLMREAMGEPSKPTNQLTETLAAIRLMRETAEEINPKNENTQPDTLMSAVGPILEIVRNSQQSKIQQPQLPSPEIPLSLQNTSPMTTESIRQSAIPNEQAKQLEFFKSQMNMLLMMAETKQDAVTCAESLYSFLPDEVIELLHENNWLEMLIEMEPRCASHREWITSVKNHIIEMIAEDDADANTQQEQSQQKTVKAPVAAMTAKKKETVK